MTNTVKLFNVSDLVIGISDYYNKLLIGVVINHRKLIGFHCYKIEWVLTAELTPIEGIEPEWHKQKYLSLFRRAINT
tara:strand:+ start:283 stop:513 length:231 start_codon:yes stop_codon:yes gene_type:complete